MRVDPVAVADRISRRVSPLSKSGDEIRSEKMLYTRFLRWRYPDGRGALFRILYLITCRTLICCYGGWGLGNGGRGVG